MNYTKFREAYKQVITESNDSELRNYIRSVVEEVLKEMKSSDEQELEEAVDSKDLTEASKVTYTSTDQDSAKRDFDKMVKNYFNDDWNKPQGVSDVFDSELRNFAKKYPAEVDRLIANKFADETGIIPIWYDKKKKRVKDGFIQWSGRGSY